MLLIRDRKDPREKKGNDQRIPLLDVSGYDAMKIIEEQGRYSNSREGRIFPYNGKSIGTAFRRQCKDLKIEDLHFHDLRHEGTSRLFEAGFFDRTGRSGYRAQRLEDAPAIYSHQTGDAPH
jgi:integrase